MKTWIRSLLALLMASGLVLAKDAVPDKDSKPLSPEEQREAVMKEIEAMGWTHKGKGSLGSQAELAIPPGYRFTSSSGTNKWLKFTRNIPSGRELGVVAPENFDWWVLFEFDDVGYVADTDKNDLDPDKLMAQLKEGQEAANEARAEQGLHKLYLDGWAMKPKYNEVTHNLEWAIKVRSETGHTSVNYLTKLLGRNGVMEATLIIDPEELDKAMPDYQKMLAGFVFKQGKTYAEYRKGDKVAQYTLAGLITAGAGVALAKSGWLAKLGVLAAKLGKVLYVAVAGVLVALKKLIMRLFGKNEEPQA